MKQTLTLERVVLSSRRAGHRLRERGPPGSAVPLERRMSTTNVVAGRTGFVQREWSGVAGQAERQA